MSNKPFLVKVSVVKHYTYPSSVLNRLNPLVDAKHKAMNDFEEFRFQKTKNGQEIDYKDFEYEVVIDQPFNFRNVKKHKSSLIDIDTLAKLKTIETFEQTYGPMCPKKNPTLFITEPAHNLPDGGVIKETVYLIAKYEDFFRETYDKFYNEFTKFVQ